VQQTINNIRHKSQKKTAHANQQHSNEYILGNVLKETFTAIKQSIIHTSICDFFQNIFTAHKTAACQHQGRKRPTRPLLPCRLSPQSKPLPSPSSSLGACFTAVKQTLLHSGKANRRQQKTFEGQTGTLISITGRSLHTEAAGNVFSMVADRVDAVNKDTVPGVCFFWQVCRFGV